MIAALLLFAALPQLEASAPRAVTGLDVDPKTMRVIVLGDDFAAARTEVTRPWSARLEASLEARSPGVRIEVENVASSGLTTASALHRLRRDVLARDPDVVLLQFGFQDSLVDVSLDADFPRVSPGAFRSNLVDLVTAVRSGGAEVILVQSGALVWTENLKATFNEPPYDPSEPFGLDRLNEAYASVVKDVSVNLDAPLIPLHEADRLRGEEAVRAMRTDGMRPNGEGHAWVAERASDICAEFARSAPLRALSAHEAPSRGWTLPEVDFAPDTERVIIVDREAGQYLGHPTTEVLEDGSILCVYPKGHGRGAIVMKRSTDGGLTWSDRLPVPESWATSKETPTLFRVPKRGESVDMGPKGVVDNLVLWSGLFPARRALSHDGGATWSELSALSPDVKAQWGGIVVVADMAQVSDGSVLAWFHDDGRFFRARKGPRDFRVLQTRSLDGGVNWSEPTSIASWKHADLCEPGFVRRGGTMALLLRENSRARNSQIIVSMDEGKAWTKPRPLAGALTGDRHQIVELPGDRLFISFRDMGLDSPRRGDWVGWVGTFDDLIQGRQGELRVRLMDNLKGTDCAYPALEVLPDGTILATTYGHWTEGEEAWIASLRLDPSELAR